MTTTGELMNNGGFEDGDFTGWTTSGAGWAVGTDPSSGSAGAQAGSYCAYNNGSSSINNYIYQDVDLSAYSAYIDAETATINVSGWYVSAEYNASPAYDLTRIQYIFLDTNHDVISTPTDTGYDNISSWTEVSLSAEPIPANTRYIRIWANTYETGYDSGSVDSFSVTLTYPDGGGGGTNQWINKDDVLREITEIQININDAWHKINQAWININDVWHKLFS